MPPILLMIGAVLGGFITLSLALDECGEFFQCSQRVDVSAYVTAGYVLFGLFMFGMGWLLSLLIRNANKRIDMDAEKAAKSVNPKKVAKAAKPGAPMPPAPGPSSVPWGPWSAVLLSVVFFLLPQIIIGLLIGSLSPLFDIDVDDIFSSNEITVSTAFYVAAESLALGFLWFYLQSKKLRWRSLGFQKANLDKLWMVIPGYGIYLIFTFTLLGISTLFLSNESLDQEQQLGFDAPTQTLEYVLAFFSLVMVAPFVEEVLFRGFMFKGLRTKLNFVLSAIISSVLFGLAHGQINVAIDVFALALVLSYLMEKTNNIWVPIGLHALKNFVAFLFLYVIDTSNLGA